MREWIKKWTLSCAGLALAVMLCETGLRLLQGVEKAADEEGRQSKGFMRHDKVVEWFPRELTHQERLDPYGRSFALRINSSGQRGEEIEERELGDRRILFLGDSFTMASDLREEDTFVPQVGDLLARERPGGTQVINGGVDAYNTFQELAYYHYYGRSLEPDIVLLCFYAGNDFRDNAVRTNRGRSLNPVLLPVQMHRKYAELPDPFLRDENRAILFDPLSGSVVPGLDSPLLEALSRKSLFSRLLGSRAARIKGMWTDDLWLIDLDKRFYFYEIGLYQQRHHPELQIAVDLTLECIEQLYRTVAADGAEFMVALIPSQNQVDPAHWLRTLSLLDLEEADLGVLNKSHPHQIIEQFCAARRIPCLDLLDAFAAADHPEEFYLTVVQDLHFSPAGHLLAAGEMADFISAQSRFLHNPAPDNFRRGLAYVQRRDLQRAEQSLRQAVAQKFDWDAPYVELGDLYRGQRRWSRAKQAYRQALKHNPLALDAHEGLGKVLTALGDRPGAIEAYQRAVQLQSSWWPHYQELQALYTGENRVREAAEARRQLEAILNAPGDAKYFWWIEHISRGTRFSTSNQWPEAEREFNRALRFASGEQDSSETLYNLGVALKHQRKEALPAFEKAFALEPGLVQAGIEAALLYEAAGKLEKGARILEKVIHQAPQWPDARVNLGILYVQTGAFEKARSAWEKALELVPDHPEIRANLAELDRLGK